MHDLTSPPMRAALAAKLSKEYDEASVAIFSEGPRTHLGASVIGEPCEALNWFQFRWIYNKVHEGRMYRLFQRGHREEPFVIEHYRKLGFVVNEIDPTTGKQYRFSGVGGHFGGGCDGRGFLPERYGYPLEVGYEIKTANKKQFEKLKKAGTVSIWKPKYARQMDVYGKAWGLQIFVFITVCKDDDHTFFEFYLCEPIQFERSMQKAERVIRTQTRPARLSDHPAFSDCKFCDLHAHCHMGKKPDVNCRSCEHASPMNGNAEWYCDLHKGTIPKDVIPLACPQWASIV